jgi:anti-anti-sigma factor
MTDANTVMIDERDGALWILLPGTLNRDNIMQIQRRIEALLTEEQMKVVLDLSNIKIAGSIVINLLLDIRKIITELKGTLYIVNLTRECLSMFKSINLDKVLNICKSEDEVE